MYPPYFKISKQVEASRQTHPLAFFAG